MYKVASDDELQESENFIQNKFGYCFYVLEPCPFIFNLYVHPQHRRQGHSRTLLQYAINEIRKAGCVGTINIQADPRENSIALNDLIKYYESMGLKVQI